MTITLMNENLEPIFLIFSLIFKEIFLIKKYVENRKIIKTSQFNALE